MKKNVHGISSGIILKKQHGQHFLKDESIVEYMANYVDLHKASVFEIGCGEGVLTRQILTHDIERLWVFEIDSDWASFVEKTYSDKRMDVYTSNILDVDFASFEPHKPWTLLANLPYVVTFPILYKLQEHRDMLKEGVIMVQEEVAQKIVKKSGRGYGYASIFFQHFFEWELLTKIKPDAFYPPPKVDSRLLYFKPRVSVDDIKDEDGFWIFIKRIFERPRKTLKNNLKSYHYHTSLLDEHMLSLRAQQLSKKELINLWNRIK
jgi:16S rRNA (adenine1518-N6/adenine1519-N6)-dimethyltransferase